MIASTLNGIIDRRILINYRIKPEIVSTLLPPHLQPLIINGYASAGICLLRLKDIGIRSSPSFLRINSENAAHRFLVTYKENGNIMQGVYIPRRDTDSLLNVFLAGKILSWPHFSDSFRVAEHDGSYFVDMRSRDGKTQIKVDAMSGYKFPSNSMFHSLEHASSCFENCSTGISPSTSPGIFKAIHLCTRNWKVSPLKIKSLSSSYFQDQSVFPPGSITFDNALLMQNVNHEWRIKK